MHSFGSEERYQAAVLDAKNDKDGWTAHWKAFEARLKVEAGLDDSNELNEAVRVYGRVSLDKKCGVQDLDKFQQEYGAARTRMVENGLITDGDPKSTIREMEDLRSKCEGTDFLRYLMDLPEYPTEVDNFDPQLGKVTFLGRMRQYVASRRRPGLPGKGDGGGDASGKPSAMFLKQQLELAAKDKKLMTQLRKSLGEPSGPADSSGKGGKQQQQQQAPEQGLAFDANNRFRGARQGDRGDKAKGDKGNRQGGAKGGDGDCPRCHGTHPECSDCPNNVASNEADFDVAKCAKEKIPCWYKHIGSNKVCGGYGHLSRHHAGCYTPDGKKQADEAREKAKAAGGGKKGGKKGSGKRRDQRLDFSDTHDAPPAEGANKALRLLDALLVSQDNASEAVSEQAKELDLGRGPGDENPVNPERNDMSGPSRMWLYFLFCLACAGRFVGKFLYGAIVVTCLAVLVTGLPRMGATSEIDNGIKHGVSEHLGIYNYNQTGSDQFFAVTLPTGYNSRGYLWIGPARCESIHDTGSTRNSIDQEYLKALLGNEQTRDMVEDVFDITPLTCTSMQKGHSFKITKMATVRVTFVESSGGSRETRTLGFVVVPNSSEDILLGKPTLDELGYVSDKDTIELRALGLRYCSILPSDCTDNATGVFLKSAYNESFTTRTGETTDHTFELVVPKQLRQGEWWLEAGPDLPPEAQLIEGPLVRSNGRAPASVLVSENLRVGPGANLAVARPMTEKDHAVLKKLKEADKQQEEGRQVLESLNAAAHKESLRRRPPGTKAESASCAARAEQFLKTSYKTRGAKERKADLFPDLQAEIAADKKAKAEGKSWPDQSSTAFQEEVVKQAEPHIGKQLSPKQRSSFCSRVLKAFSCCFWLPGCDFPRVTGYAAHIEPLPNAVPKVQQPFPLSAFDELRMRYHEDCEVAEGRAEWVPPGQAGRWGSPSFIVDSDSKGLLGRPVRDYRYPNSQTQDVPWPTPNAHDVLNRAQRGAIHSTLDLVWGFNQLEIDKSTGELLQLVTRRGILRPKVLFFGPKQGPGLFQGFMDHVFGGLRDKRGDEYCSIFMDDVSISTEGFEGDSDDDVVQRHIEHCECFLTAAKAHGVQFKLSKCRWATLEVKLLGFQLGNGCRSVDPGKVKAMREWPEPKIVEDIVSFRAFANFVKEFIPRFHELDAHLRPFTKKGCKNR